MTIALVAALVIGEFFTVLVITAFVVLVAPGECIAVDGSVRTGHSYVDQATITGESTPVEKDPGAVVYAGTINQSGTLELVADRLGRDTSFGKIVEAVEHAERSRAPRLSPRLLPPLRRWTLSVPAAHRLALVLCRRSPL